MGWIDDPEKRWLTARERDAKIAAHATGIYEALWAEVLNDVNNAKESIARFSGLTTNGHQLAHIISFPMDHSSAGIAVPPGVSITLLKREQQIGASVRGADSEDDLRFVIDVCNSDGAVCLKMDGRKISYEEASRRILTVFLYPGLPYVAPSDNTLDSVMRASTPGHLKAPRIGI